MPENTQEQLKDFIQSHPRLAGNNGLFGGLNEDHKVLKFFVKYLRENKGGDGHVSKEISSSHFLNYLSNSEVDEEEINKLRKQFYELIRTQKLHDFPLGNNTLYKFALILNGLNLTEVNEESAMHLYNEALTKTMGTMPGSTVGNTTVGKTAEVARSKVPKVPGTQSSSTTEKTKKTDKIEDSEDAKKTKIEDKTNIESGGAEFNGASANYGTSTNYGSSTINKNPSPGMNSAIPTPDRPKPIPTENADNNNDDLDKPVLPRLDADALNIELKDDVPEPEQVITGDEKQVIPGDGLQETSEQSSEKKSFLFDPAITKEAKMRVEPLPQGMGRQRRPSRKKRVGDKQTQQQQAQQEQQQQQMQAQNAFAKQRQLAAQAQQPQPKKSKTFRKVAYGVLGGGVLSSTILSGGSANAAGFSLVSIMFEIISK